MASGTHKHGSVSAQDVSIASQPNAFVVSVSEGGTGATTAAQARANLGATNIQLLWENTSPSSSMAAGTIIPVDTTYDLYVVIYKRDANVEGMVASVITFNGRGVFMFHGSGYSNSVYARELTWGTNGFVAGSGFAASATANTSVVIPLRIYGIRI